MNTRFPNYLQTIYSPHRTTHAPVCRNAHISQMELAYPALRKGDTSIIIPGLKDTISVNFDGATRLCHNFVPQGMCYAHNLLLISAYDGDHLCRSVIYVLNAVSGNYITTIVTPGTAHVGGMAYDFNADYIWISHGMAVGGFPANILDDIVEYVNNNPDVSCFGLTRYQKKLTTLTQASFLTYYNNLLWVGKFNKTKSDYIYGYKIDYEENALIPACRFDTPRQSQGMTFIENGKETFVAISTSYGVTNSSLFVYKTNIIDRNLPLGILTSKHKTYTLPPMAENITLYENKILVLFESAALKYRNNPVYNSFDRILSIEVDL